MVSMCHPDTVLSWTTDPPQASFAGSSACLWKKDANVLLKIKKATFFNVAFFLFRIFFKTKRTV